MSKRKRIHVVPHSNGWALKTEGNTRASSTHRTKAEAVQRAREAGRSSENSQVLIHGQNGQIQTEHTYGNDPYPPEG